MTSPLSKDDTPALPSEERDFVEQLAEHYSPPPMTESERVAFDEALESRLSRRDTRTRILKPVAVALALGSFGAWLVFHNAIRPDLTGQGEIAPPVLSETAEQREDVGDVLLGFAFDDPNGLDTDEWLPEEYMDISILLNDMEG
jgi:hypothetical protein